ncbi:MAG: methyltransferase domain-containing protein [Nitrospirae bacterium]|nr:methyltransferase domain-containing protein [Nitrospirota bacterium]
MKWDAERYDSTKAPQIDAGRELIDAARVRETDAVIDIGCGTGKLTVEIARLAHKGSVTGIDPSVEMLEKARGISTGFSNLSFRQVEAQSLDFTDTFDLAFSNSAMQWVKAQGQALNRIYLALKPGGRIAFQMPPKNFCKEFLDYTAETVEQPEFEKYFRNWELPWYFTLQQEYEAMLMDTGFKKVDVSCREYRYVFSSISEVIDWWVSAGLRPFLAELPEGEQEGFKHSFAVKFERNKSANGIEFGFRRLFAFAER